MHLLILICSIWAATTSAATQFSNPALRQNLTAPDISGTSSSPDLIIDLGYEQYQGVSDASSGLDIWLGIRYAAPPTGSLRWQKPQAPAVNRSEVLPANALPPHCPQAPIAPLDTPFNDGFNFTGDEDCLFLSVYAPPNAKDLPVLVWIHGGGYGFGSGNRDLRAIINANNDSFIGIAIQYRLGAFGFLSSDEVMQHGVVNAGLLDQVFALRWIQEHIGLFGGDASRVTISGESAGGGSVMHLAMAYGGSLGDSLFSNLIAASPYLPQQYGYKDSLPSQTYHDFASAVSCSSPIFECLVTKDTETLQNANYFVSGSGRFGTWAFLPVTDGTLIEDIPSRQLSKMQVNGNRMLAGNNANEGPYFFEPSNIVTEDDFGAYVRSLLPLFNDDDIAQVLLHYPSTDAADSPNAPEFATSGVSGPTALNESTFASGQQQRADNLYGELTFVCPSYWLADAFTSNGRTAHHYQYSVIGAEHGADVSAYFGPPTPNQSPDFVKAFMTISGNFITMGNPSITSSIANGEASPSTTSPASEWPAWTLANRSQLNLNETGGTAVFAESFGGIPQNITQFVEPGLMNSFEIVDAYTWEGGRGARCDFWKKMGPVVPE